MEEAPENGKETPHSSHANGMNGWLPGFLGCDITSRAMTVYITHASLVSSQSYSQLIQPLTMCIAMRPEGSLPATQNPSPSPARFSPRRPSFSAG